MEFYRKLHLFLKKCEQTRLATKASLGRFYVSIDKQLQERESTPNNTYLFIEKVVASDRPNTALIPYYAITAHSHTEQQDVYEDQIQDHDCDTNTEVESIKTELICIQESFKKISHEKNIMFYKEKETEHIKNTPY